VLLERERGRGRERDKLGPNLEQLHGISYLKKEMERDRETGEVRIG
jgi:hypothetical protein